MRKQFTTPNRGFTLIEILMVVFILGIVAACVLPQISNRDDLKTAAAARVTMADLMYAQNRAISLQQMDYVSFDPTHSQYSLLSDWSSTTYLTHPLTKNNYITYFSTAASNSMKYVTLVSANFDGNAGLAFDTLGTPYSVTSSGTTTALVGQGQIVLQAGSNIITVTVEPYTGEINVQ